MDGAYLIVPEVYSTVGSISWPFASNALSKLKTARHIAIVINREESANSLPGQILEGRNSRQTSGVPEQDMQAKQ